MDYHMPDCVVVDTSSELKAAIEDIKQAVHIRNEMLAVDCEGVKLSRRGELTVATVATKSKVYLFDVLVLGKVVFSEGLKDILESESVKKLMFDCKQDSDCLFHNHQVKLAGILDVQLLLSLHNNRNGFLMGFNKTLMTYLPMKCSSIKETTSRMLVRNPNLWKERPLTQEKIQYCCVDTHTFFSLFKKLSGNSYLKRLGEASDRYVDLFRKKSHRKYDKYEEHCLMPAGILQESYGDCMCQTCCREFAKEDFNSSRGRCRVCVKRDTLRY